MWPPYWLTAHLSHGSWCFADLKNWHTLKKTEKSSLLSSSWISLSCYRVFPETPDWPPLYSPEFEAILMQRHKHHLLGHEENRKDKHTISSGLFWFALLTQEQLFINLTPLQDIHQSCRRTGGEERACMRVKSLTINPSHTCQFTHTNRQAISTEKKVAVILFKHLSL